MISQCLVRINLSSVHQIRLSLIFYWLALDLLCVQRHQADTLATVEKELKALKSQAAAKAQSEEDLPVLGGMKMLMGGSMAPGNFY